MCGGNVWSGTGQRSSARHATLPAPWLYLAISGGDRLDIVSWPPMPVRRRLALAALPRCQRLDRELAKRMQLAADAARCLVWWAKKVDCDDRYQSCNSITATWRPTAVGSVLAHLPRRSLLSSDTWTASTRRKKPTSDQHHIRC
jgi:hypothetical protein